MEAAQLAEHFRVKHHEHSGREWRAEEPGAALVEVADMVSQSGFPCSLWTQDVGRNAVESLRTHLLDAALKQSVAVKLHVSVHEQNETGRSQRRASIPPNGGESTGDDFKLEEVEA